MAKTQWTLEQNESTPFNALKEYDRLMGEKCREAQAWRLRAIITMAANVILLAIAGISVTQNKTVPVFISENELGELSYMGTYTKNYGAGQITQRMVYAQLNSFVTNMYTIPQDAEVLRSNMRFCYAALTSQSATKFTRFQKEDNPFDNFGMKNQRVSVESILELSESSYQVDFIVEVTLADGGAKKNLRKRAVLTTVLLEPSKDDIYLNPAGIYISNFDITDLGETTK